MALIVILVLLIVIYVQARDRGFNAVLVTTLAAITPALVLWVLEATGNGNLRPLLIAVPAAILVLLYAMKPRPGAPPRTITFQCPSCHRTIVSPRHRSGLVALCPSCGDTLTVPSTGGPAEPSEVERRKPDVREGQVVFARYSDVSAAECLAGVLVESGVPAEVLTEDPSGVLPPVIAPRSRVVIDVADWDRAVEIERSWIKTTWRR